MKLPPIHDTKGTRINVYTDTHPLKGDVYLFHPQGYSDDIKTIYELFGRGLIIAGEELSMNYAAKSPSWASGRQDQLFYVEQHETIVDAIEDEFNTTFVTEPADTNTHEEITLTITEPSQNTPPQVHIDPLPDRVATLLTDQLSYTEEDWSYGSRSEYRRSLWNDVNGNSTQTVPIGLADRVQELLTSAGYTVTCDGADNRNGASISDQLEWQFSHSLREYQRQAVDALTEANGGIISLPTGTGKTITALRYLYEQPEQTLVVAHTQQLLNQWIDRIETILGLTREHATPVADKRTEPLSGVGRIDQHAADEGAITLLSRGSITHGNISVADLSGDYGTIIFDECHTTAGSETVHELFAARDELTVSTRIGLSATPWRRLENQKLKFEAITGPEVYHETPTDMIRAGYMANPRFEYLDPASIRLSQSQKARSPPEDRHKQHLHQVATNTNRLSAIAETAATIAHSNNTVLIPVQRTVHAKLLAWLLGATTERDIRETELTDDTDLFDRQAITQALSDCTPDQFPDIGALLLGRTPTETRKKRLANFSDSSTRPNVLISTLIKEGINIPSLNAIITAGGHGSSIQTIQMIGRALRPDSTTARVIDIPDTGQAARSFVQRQTAIADYYDLQTYSRRQDYLSALPRSAV